MLTFRALLLLTLIAICARGQSLFTLASGHPKAAGITGPRAVAVADCNGDRRPDAVIAGDGYQLFYSDAAGASLALAAADGAAFQQAHPVVSTDFNSDGVPDIAVRTFFGVEVFIGQVAGGSCSYARVTTLNVDPTVYGVLVGGDFNRDGKVDLAVTTETARVQTFMGNGDGTFQPPITRTAPIDVRSTAVADFDGDGNFDLAVVNRGDIQILKGEATGAFTLLPGRHSTGQAGTKTLAAADFNTDGKPDLAVTNLNSKSVSILLGNGDGTFTGLHTGLGSYALGYLPGAVTTGDFDGDGRPDLAIAYADATAVSVWLGTGGGDFSEVAGSPFATGGITPSFSPAAITAADLNGDTRPDLWVVGSGGLAVLENQWPNIVAPAQLEFHATTGQSPAALPAPISGASGPYTVRTSAPWLSAAASGATVTVSAASAAMAPGTYSGTVWVTAANAYGAAIRVTLTIAAPSGTLVEAPGSQPAGNGIPYLADINLDGKLDLLLLSLWDYNVAVLLGNGNGGFAPPPGGGTAAVSNLSNPQFLAVADFNGDRWPDFAVTLYEPNRVRVFLGNGAGGFTGAVSYSASRPTGIVAADWNLDGKMDFVVDVEGGYVIYSGNGDGTFTPSARENTQCRSHFLAAADFNVDGKPDLAISEDCTTPRAIVRYGDGRGGFPTSAILSKSYAGLTPLFAGDINRDGKPDFAVGNLNLAVDVFLSNGAGTFDRSEIYLPIRGSLAGADMDGDGKLDLAAGSGQVFDYDSNLMVSVTGSPLRITTFRGARFPMVAAGDLNGDGRADVVISELLGTGNLRVLLGAKTPSTTTLTAGVSSPSVAGQSVTFRATVAGIRGPSWCDDSCSSSFALPAGTVTFKDGANVLATATPLAIEYIRGVPYATATFTTSALTLGTHNLSVEYSGDVRAEPSTGSLTWSVQPKLEFSPPPAGVQASRAPFDVRVDIRNFTGGIFNSYNVPVTLTLTGPGGFESGGNAVTVHAVNGVANFTGLSVRAPGAYTLTVTAAGIISGSTALTIQGNPLALNPAALAFQAVFGRAAPAGQTVTLSIPAGTASYTAAASQPWIAAPGSGTLPGAIQVTVQTAGLQPGNYSGVITLTPEAGYNPATIAVTLTVVPPNDVTAQPAALAVSAMTGASDSFHTVQLRSGAPVVCSAAASAAWLRAAPSVDVPGPLALTIVSSGLNRGAHSATITLTCAGAHNSPVAIPVTLTVFMPPSLTAYPEDLRFQYEIAGPFPGVQQVQVEDSRGGTPSIAPRSSAAWLKTASLPSTAPGLVRVWVDPAGLAPGTYTGSVFIAAGLEVPVTLVVTPQPRLAAKAADLSFRAVQGGENPPEQILYFTAGGRPVKFTVKATGAWLRVVVVNSSTLVPANLRVRAEVSGLAPGTYRGAIEITAPEAVNSPMIIPVLLVVDAQPPVFPAGG